MFGWELGLARQEFCGHPAVGFRGLEKRRDSAYPESFPSDHTMSSSKPVFTRDLDANLQAISCNLLLSFLPEGGGFLAPGLICGHCSASRGVPWGHSAPRSPGSDGWTTCAGACASMSEAQLRCSRFGQAAERQCPIALACGLRNLCLCSASGGGPWGVLASLPTADVWKLAHVAVPVAPSRLPCGR